MDGRLYLPGHNLKCILRSTWSEKILEKLGNDRDRWSEVLMNANGSALLLVHAKPNLFGFPLTSTSNQWWDIIPQFKKRISLKKSKKERNKNQNHLKKDIISECLEYLVLVMHEGIFKAWKLADSAVTGTQK